MLRPENYFLLDLSPLSLVEKGRLFWLSWQEMQHLVKKITEKPSDASEERSDTAYSRQRTRNNFPNLRK